jgi:hypothetical protein
MPKVRISQLPAASALTGAEIFPVVQGGVTSQTTLSNAIALVPSQTPVSYLTYPFLIRNVGTSSTYTFRQWLNASFVNPYPGVNTPAEGSNGVATVNMLPLFQNLALSSAEITTGSAASYVSGGNSWANGNLAMGQWVFVPVVFAASMTFNYVALQAFQSSAAGSVYGQGRVQIYSNNPTTNAPATVIADGGVQTLPTFNGGTNYPAAGSYLCWNTASWAVTAGQVYWVALNLGMSNATFTNSVGFQIGYFQLSRAFQQSSSRSGAGANLLNTRYTWWQALGSTVSPSIALGANPTVTNIGSDGTIQAIPNLYFLT